MTARDRYVIAVVAVVGLIGAFWFMGLSPKREQSAKLDKDIAAAQQSAQTAEQEKVQFAQAQVEFPTLYASVGRLGKAVPANEDVPSLLVQLHHAAAGTGVDFRSIELKVDQSKEDAPAAPPAEGSADGEPAAGGEAGAASAPASGSSTPAAGATGATGAAGTAPASQPETAGGAPDAAASAVATLQPLPFEYKFRGNFFQLKRMLAALADLVESRNREVAISGRLISVDGFTLKQGKVTILATSYLLPAGQSLLGGATPEGPPGVDPNAPQPASAGSSTPAPPTATVTTP